MLRVIFTILVVCCCASVSAQHKVEKVINVSGSGTVTAVPDVLQFNVYLEEQGKLASKLNQTISAKSEQIVDFLSRQGVDKKDIQSMRVDLRPFFRRTPEGQVQDGYVFSRVIKISLRNLGSYPQILDGVLKFGANRIDSFTYMIEDQDDLYLKALELATQNARKRADRLASSLGVKVGDVVAINEASGYAPVPMQEKVMLMSDARGGMSAGSINVTASLNVQFALQ